MTSNERRSGRGRPLLGLAALLLAGGALAAEEYAGPRYTYLGAGYEWNDVKYAVKADSNRHEGFKLEGGLGVLSWLHVYGEYFNGTFGDAPEDDSEGFHVGAGVNLPLFSDRWDIVLRAAYVDVEAPAVQLSPVVLVDDDGYQVEGLIRGMVGERVELNLGYAYTDIDESDIKSRDVTIGLLYGITDNLALKARATVFDNDSGFELGVRWYLGDSLF